jgi:hypothetical protein
MTVDHQSILDHHLDRRQPDHRGVERRKWARYPVRLEMLIVAVGPDPTKIPAFTCNVSRSGLLFQCTRSLEEGLRLEYILGLSPSVQLKCSGRILRWSGPSLENNYRIAATLESYQSIRVGARQVFRSSEH